MVKLALRVIRKLANVYVKLSSCAVGKTTTLSYK
jgi:hypothetical protein